MDKYWKKLSYEQDTLELCNEEDINHIGAIQPHAYLALISIANGEIIALSENFTNETSLVANNFIGKSYEQLEPLAFIIESLNDIKAEGRQNLKLDIPNFGSIEGYTWIQSNFRYIEVELLESNALKSDFNSWFPKDLLSISKLTELYEQSVNKWKDLSHFDRVMIYRFEPNGDGYVISESKNKELEPFLGLRYPASDIPQIARQALFISDSRSIVDVDSIPASVITKKGLAPSDINLQKVHFRASSPYHIQYLKNMGVKATLTIPIKVAGQLWGLIACHNYSCRKNLTSTTIKNSEILGNILSSSIQNLENIIKVKAEKEILELSSSVLKKIASGQSIESAFSSRKEDLLRLTNANGISVKIANEIINIGDCPTQGSLDSILEYSNTYQRGAIWHTRNSKELNIKSCEASVGILAIPMSVDFSDYLIWFRPEVQQTITWAGKQNLPPKSAKDDLSPRQSFKIWNEVNRGLSLEWTKTQQDSAQFMLFTFVNDVFKKAKDLANANIKLDRLSKSKDEFISTVSHELRTPLNAIVGWVEILKQDSSLNTDAKEAVTTIARNAKAQVSLINDLLDISRISSGKLRVNFENSVDISMLISEVIKDLKPTANTKSVNMHLDCKPKLYVSGDPERLRQIIWNLISNSIKFNKKGGDVSIKVEVYESSYKISVADTGAGIPKDELSSIFDKFSQVKSSDGSKRSSGLGLGLSIVKALVELHGGSISVTSEGHGQGTAFRIVFPIFALQPTNNNESISSSAPEPDLVLDQLNILIVEDQPDAARALEIILRQLGAKVDVAYDGNSAYNSFAENSLLQPYDLILSDIGLPEFDGLKLIQKIRKLEVDRGVRRTPALALTAYASSIDRVKCLRAGFDSHLPKPIDRDELIFMIETTTQST